MPIPLIPLLIAGAAGGALVGASMSGGRSQSPDNSAQIAAQFSAQLADSQRQFNEMREMYESEREEMREQLAAEREEMRAEREAERDEMRQEAARREAQFRQREAKLQQTIAIQQQKAQAQYNKLQRETLSQISQLQQALDVERADKAELRRINDEVIAFSQSAAQQMDEVERELFKIGEQYIAALAESLNSNLARKEAFSAKCLRDLRKNKGLAAQDMRARISLGDAECKQLLQMQPGEKKQRLMSDFVQRIAENSFNSIRDELIASLNESVTSACAAYRQDIAVKKNRLEAQVAQLGTIQSANNATERERELLRVAVELARNEATLAAVDELAAGSAGFGGSGGAGGARG